VLLKDTVNTPPKTTTQKSYVKAMISMDLKGFGLCPLVWKKNPPLGRVSYLMTI
jgi:hypothetical protein